ncbi:hypothetical protein [Neosynechococcus sphagnicola]|nr:hypothetical protein [Neosynechococcus sphagnicola]
MLLYIKALGGEILEILLHRSVCWGIGGVGQQHQGRLLDHRWIHWNLDR